MPKSSGSLQGDRIHFVFSKFHPPYPPNPTLMIDWKRVKSWLESTPPVPRLASKPRGFKLIDVEEKRVVEAPDCDFEYVCLSYCWGDVKTFQSNKDRINDLHKIGSLGVDEVPATLQDAMTVCQVLEKRYLWVDRLCILQDNSDGSIEEQIDQMGHIYNHAYATIAAIEGLDPHCGLHGVSDCLRLEVFRESDYFIRRSKWATRGWTYQESLLSRRLMLFTAQDVVLEHRASGAWDASYLESHLGGRGSILQRIDYKTAVEHYTVRELGYPKDALRAFCGIYNTLFQGEHRFGLPLIGFDNAICWVPCGNHRRRRISENNSPCFPSWSWTSIQGDIKIVQLGQFKDRAIAVASWAFVDSVDKNGNPTVTFPWPENFDFRYPGYLSRPFIDLATLASEEGCMFIGPETGYSKGRNSEEGSGKESFLKRWSSYTEFWKACRGISQNMDNQASPPYLNEFSNHQKKLAAELRRISGLSQAVVLSVRPTLRCEEDSEGDSEGGSAKDFEEERSDDEERGNSEKVEKEKDIEEQDDTRQDEKQVDEYNGESGTSGDDFLIYHGDDCVGVGSSYGLQLRKFLHRIRQSRLLLESYGH
ncbi:heterokaryon incompatibility protein-domain-containing protein [Phyllosticta paracitricarpa]|uniref:Heterokaryon incompatibility protein-domain-containing protein n=1 Tax=Phyllosticta paracitricarpa TaxID=2016321 RepID=A0ABR1NFI2_9PEZI